MRLRLPHLLLFVSLFGMGGVLHGQDLRIVKDNIACTYGLKNQQGQWIVNPKFTLIEQMGEGEFQTTAGLTKGILDKNGKEILPPEYDQIRRLGTPWHPQSRFHTSLHNYRYEWKKVPALYVVTQNSKKGLVNHKGTFIFPADFSDIRSGKCPQVYLYRYGEQFCTSLYADTTGQLLMPQQTGYLLRFNRDSLAPIGDRYLGAGASGNAGVIDQSGKLVVPRIYDQLEMMSDGKIAVARDNKHGTVDRNGEILVPLRYTVLNEKYSDRNLPWLSGPKVWQIKEGSFYGLLSGDGEVRLAPTMDTLIQNHHEQRTPSFEWKVYNKGKIGTADPAGRLVIEPKYDTLITLPWFLDPKHRSKLSHIHLVAKTNKGFGLLTDAGEVIQPVECDTFLVRKTAQRTWVFFRKGKNITGYDLSQPQTQPVSATFIAAHDTLQLYRIDTSMVLFSQDWKHPLELGYYNRYVIFHCGDKLILSTKDQCLVFTPEGELWGGNAIRSINRGYQSRFYELKTYSGKVALLDPTTGKMVTDTLFLQFDQPHSTPERIWARPWFDHPPGPEYQCGGWMLIDPEGNPISDQVYDWAFQQNIIRKVAAGGKAGILNGKTLEWLWPPQFGELTQIEGPLWRAYSSTGKVGLITTEGQFLADTVYTSIEEIFYNPSSRPGVDHPTLSQRWWILQKEDSTLLLNEQGHLIKDPIALKAKQMELAFQDTTRHTPNVSRTAHLIHMTPGAERNFTDTTFHTHLYDLTLSFFNRYNVVQRMPFIPSPCVRHSSDLLYNEEARTFNLLYYSAFAYSLEVQHMKRDSYEFDISFHTIHQRFNFALKAGSLTPVAFEDLFGSDVFLEGEVVRAIQRRDDLTLDCSSPANLAADVAGRFSLSEHGVILYLVQGNRNWAGIELLVPWDRFKDQADAQWVVDQFEK